MKKNLFSPVDGSTHVAIIGTYNKLWAIVRQGENMEERVTKAIRSYLQSERYPSGDVLEIEVNKLVATVKTKGSNYTNRKPFIIQHVTEF
jgi:hypothetical protein